MPGGGSGFHSEQEGCGPDSVVLQGGGGWTVTAVGGGHRMERRACGAGWGAWKSSGTHGGRHLTVSNATKLYAQNG